jgi:ATP-dependent helicase HrpB
LFVAAEIREIEGKHDELLVLLTQATAVREEWLRELYPHDFQEREEVYLDGSTRRVQARSDLIFRDLVLHSNRLNDPSREAAAEILAREVLAGRIMLANWSPEVDQWITRLNCLSTWCPELQLPGIAPADRAYLIQQICYGAFSMREVKERPVWPVIRQWLSAAQRDLVDQFAPERLELPNGRRAKLAYSENQPPVLAARIQDLYGVEGSLKICRGRITVQLQVLAPNHRPVQITQDLSTFWKESYPKLKQELQRRYPKHEWR